MSIQVQKLTKEELQKYLSQFSYKNQLHPDLIRYLKKDGWKFQEYCMIKRHKKYFIYVEFCIGDYCVYPGSKKEGSLLESKQRCLSIPAALIAAAILQKRIDDGEHWVGENN